MLSMSKVIFSAILICSLNIYFVFSGVSFAGYKEKFIKQIEFSKETAVRGRKFLCQTHAPDFIAVNSSFKRVNRTTEFWSFNVNYLVPIKNLHVSEMFKIFSTLNKIVCFSRST